MKKLLLKNKNILVTGSKGFLGKYIMNALMLEEAIPIGVDTKDAEFNADLSNSKEIYSLYHNVYNKYKKIDGIVNNAAISIKGNSAHITREDFDKTFAVNVSGTNECIYHFSKKIYNASIVNVASIYGYLSPNFDIYRGDNKEFNSIAYGSSKAAIIQMTKYYAALLADKNIRVNAISPGGIYQNQSNEFVKLYSKNVPLNRMCKPEEVINVILFLLSHLSSYITGANIPVTGGLDIL